MRPKEEAKLSLVKLLKGCTIDAAVRLRVDDVAGSIRFILPELVVFEGRVIEGTAKP